MTQALLPSSQDVLSSRHEDDLADVLSRSKDPRDRRLTTTTGEVQIATTAATAAAR